MNDLDFITSIEKLKNEPIPYFSMFLQTPLEATPLETEHKTRIIYEGHTNEVSI